MTRDNECSRCLPQHKNNFQSVNRRSCPSRRPQNLSNNIICLGQNVEAWIIFIGLQQTPRLAMAELTLLIGRKLGRYAVLVM